RLTDSPVVELNRAVAVAEEQGPEAGLAIVDRLALEDYRYLHSTRGELLRRLGRAAKARDAYRRALALVHDDAERRLLERRVAEVLREYETWPGVGVQRFPFGTSGHEQRPSGLVIENYLRRATVVNKIIKSIVDPTRVAQASTAHHFVYPPGTCAVDELKRP